MKPPRDERHFNVSIAGANVTEERVSNFGILPLLKKTMKKIPVDIILLILLGAFTLFLGIRFLSPQNKEFREWCIKNNI